MNKHEIFRFIDHTLLKQNAVWEQIREICQEGMDFGTASVCIPPSFVKQAASNLLPMRRLFLRQGLTDWAAVPFLPCFGRKSSSKAAEGSFGSS